MWKVLIILAAGFLIISAASPADVIYRWRDAQGVLHYSDTLRARRARCQNAEDSGPDGKPEQQYGGWQNFDTRGRAARVTAADRHQLTVLRLRWRIKWWRSQRRHISRRRRRHISRGGTSATGRTNAARGGGTLLRAHRQQLSRLHPHQALLLRPQPARLLLLHPLHPFACARTGPGCHDSTRYGLLRLRPAPAPVVPPVYGLSPAPRPAPLFHRYGLSPAPAPAPVVTIPPVTVLSACARTAPLSDSTGYSSTACARARLGESLVYSGFEGTTACGSE